MSEITKVVTDVSHYNEIAKTIQGYTGDATMTPSEMAENIHSVWDAGHQEGYEGGFLIGRADGIQAQYDEFWDNYQKNGEKGPYVRVFQGGRWTDITFNPKYDILASNLQACFHSNSQITRIPVLVDVSTSSNMSQAFYGCSALTQLRLKVSEDTPFASNTFQACYGITDLSLEGTVGQSLDLSDCSQLSETTLANIVDNLATVSVATTLTLHKTAKAKLTDTQIGTIDEKGWTLA